MYGQGIGKCGYKTKTPIWGKKYIVDMKLWPG